MKAQPGHLGSFEANASTRLLNAGGCVLRSQRYAISSTTPTEMLFPSHIEPGQRVVIGLEGIAQQLSRDVSQTVAVKVQRLQLGVCCAQHRDEVLSSFVTKATVLQIKQLETNGEVQKRWQRSGRQTSCMVPCT